MVPISSEQLTEHMRQTCNSSLSVRPFPRLSPGHRDGHFLYPYNVQHDFFKKHFPEQNPSDCAGGVSLFRYQGPTHRDPVLDLPFNFVSVASFSPFSVRREAFLDVGGMDEAAADPGECGIQADWELSMRFWWGGWQVGVLTRPGAQALFDGVRFLVVLWRGFGDVSEGILGCFRGDFRLFLGAVATPCASRTESTAFLSFAFCVRSSGREGRTRATARRPSAGGRCRCSQGAQTQHNTHTNNTTQLPIAHIPPCTFAVASRHAIRQSISPLPWRDLRKAKPPPGFLCSCVPRRNFEERKSGSPSDQARVWKARAKYNQKAQPRGFHFDGAVNLVRWGGTHREGAGASARKVKLSTLPDRFSRSLGPLSPPLAQLIQESNAQLEYRMEGALPWERCCLVRRSGRAHLSFNLTDAAEALRRIPAAAASGGRAACALKAAVSSHDPLSSMCIVQDAKNTTQCAQPLRGGNEYSPLPADAERREYPKPVDGETVTEQPPPKPPTAWDAVQAVGGEAGAGAAARRRGLLVSAAEAAGRAATSREDGESEWWREAPGLEGPGGGGARRAGRTRRRALLSTTAGGRRGDWEGRGRGLAAAEEHRGR